jgi:integral membrane protein (TIGR01906 family)
MRSASPSRPLSILTGAATAVVLIAVAILPFLTPAWLGFAQERAQAMAWTGYSQADLDTATNALLHDVLIGPPAFDVAVGGEPVLTPAERGHLADVRGVFVGVGLLALAAAFTLAVILVRGRAWPAVWRSVRSGALALAGGVAVLGIVAAVAFEPAFEVFHRLFFAGNYAFDPRTDRLVQIFPAQLWFETTIAVGVVIAALALVVAWASGRRVARLVGGEQREQLEVEPARRDLRSVRP